MSIQRNFHTAVRAATTADDAADLLPTALVRAAAAVLPADGAGLSLIDASFRIPLGASSSDAAAAERAQFTHGEGPCLTGLQTGIVIVATLDAMQRRWPAYADDLLRSTSYRSVMSVPLRFDAGHAGAMDLYFTGPESGPHVDMINATIIAAEITSALSTAFGGRRRSRPDHHLPTWAASPAAAARTRVWTAIGIVMAAHPMTGPDALARIRAYAYARDLTVDDLADALITHRIDANDIVDSR